MKNPKTILIVCRGNIAHSPFAAAVIRHELALRGLEHGYRVISRGVQGAELDPEPVRHPNITHYPAIYEPVKAMLAELCIDLSNARSKVVDEPVVRKARLVLAMDTRTRQQLVQLFPEQADKVCLFSELAGKQTNITDPEQSADTIRDVFLQARQIVVGNFSQLIAMVNQ